MILETWTWGREVVVILQAHIRSNMFLVLRGCWWDTPAVSGTMARLCRLCYPKINLKVSHIALLQELMNIHTGSNGVHYEVHTSYH